LRKFWFRLETLPRPTAINLGCGVMAYTKDDAMRLLRDHVFDRHGLLSIIECIEDAGMDQIEQNHARPNIGNTDIRGIWFPQDCSPE
jgi:hypothetical protein